MPRSVGRRSGSRTAPGRARHSELAGDLPGRANPDVVMTRHERYEVVQKREPAWLSNDLRMHGEMQAPPIFLMPRNSSSQTERTAPVVAMVFVQEASANQKCAASSRVQCTGTSTSAEPACRYGRMSSMRLEE